MLRVHMRTMHRETQKQCETQPANIDSIEEKSEQKTANKKTYTKK